MALEANTEKRTMEVGNAAENIQWEKTKETYYLRKEKEKKKKS